MNRRLNSNSDKQAPQKTRPDAMLCEHNGQVGGSTRSAKPPAACRTVDPARRAIRGKKRNIVAAGAVSIVETWNRKENCFSAF